MARRWQDPQSASELGRLDPEAIERVRAEAWPDPANAEELHDALLWLGCLTEAEAQAGPGWADWLEALAREKRVTRLQTPQAALWIPAERLTQFAAVWPEAPLEPPIAPPGDSAALWEREAALVEILRGRLEGLGPVTEAGLGGAAGTGARTRSLARSPRWRLRERILRGRFSPGANDEQWCDRRLLARIHHYDHPAPARGNRTGRGARFPALPVRLAACREDTRLEGPDALPVALAALQAFEAPARAWETEILPARIAGYQPSWLDAQCLAGRTTWARLSPPSGPADRARPAASVRATPIALLDRRDAPLWMSLASTGRSGATQSPRPNRAGLPDRAGRLCSSMS